MKISTQMLVQEALSKAGIGKDINDPITLSDKQFQAVAEHIDNFLTELENDYRAESVPEHGVTECNGLGEHFSEFELKTLNQVTTDLYYEALKTDDRKYLTTQMVEELNKPLDRLREKIAEALDQADTDLPF